jgi:hypothetical protein
MESQGWGWVTVQWMVLLHTLLGLLVVVVFGWYQWRHYFTVRPEAVDWGKLLGYFTFWLFVVSAVTGLILTWQASFGTNITYWLDAVHTWASFALVPLLVWHLTRIGLRARKAANADFLPALRHAQWRLAWRGAAVLGLLIVVGLGLGLGTNGADISAGVPPQTYSLKYGEDPFLPSNVKSSTGGAINA